MMRLAAEPAVTARVGLALLLAVPSGAACAQAGPALDARVRAAPQGAAPMTGGDDIRFEGLADLVTRRGARSIDELLPLLPEAFRSRYVLVHESRSVQGASYRSPRVLLHGRDAKFVVSYNGEPGQSGYDKLETMEFDDRARAFRFREVAFPKDATPGARAIISQSNPPQCLACHGEEPRPVWDTYPTWPGTYGEEERSRPGPDEAAGLASFFARRASSPRYRVLVGLESFAAPRPSDDVAAYEGRDVLSHNAEFGVLLQALAHRVTAREVTSSPRFRPFRYALLAALDPQCLDIGDFVPEAVRAGFSRSASAFEAETGRANAGADLAKGRRMHGLLQRFERDAARSIQRESLIPFRYLVEEGLGLSTRGWTLALEKSTYDFTTPRAATRVLEREILDSVARTDPDVRRLRGSLDHRDDYCAALRKRSLLALAR